MTELPPRLQQSLIARTRDLLTLDNKIKNLTSKKSATRQGFFDLVTKAVSNDLQTKVVESDKDADQVVAENPGWLLKSVKGIRFLLEEDPAFKKFSFTNPENGKVFGRTYAEQGASFDCDGLYQDHQALAEQVLDFCQVFVYLAGNWSGDGENPGSGETYSFNEKAAQVYCADHPEAVAILQQYATPGVLQVRLAPVKDSK